MSLALLNETRENGLVNPQKLTDLTLVKSRFVGLYNQVHGLPVDDRRGEMYFAAEQMHFSQRLMDDEKLRRCTPLSLYKAFINTAINGLSFDPSKNQVYLIPYGEQCKTEVSPYGEAAMRINQGIIEGYDDPILVFDCDQFEPEQVAGSWKVSHKPKYPRPKDSQIIAAYVNIHRPDGTIMTVIFGMDEINQFKAKSKNPKQYEWAGMIKAKVLKHAMKRQPAVRILGEQIAIQKEEKIAIDYGFDEMEDHPEPQPEPTQVPEFTPNTPTDTEPF